jgi:prevent-host-death family protein
LLARRWAGRYIAPAMKFLTSREFNRDVSLAKREARSGPVLITDRGRPTHVLISIADYRRLSGEQDSILDLLAMPAPPPLEADADGAWDARPVVG